MLALNQNLISKIAEPLAHHANLLAENYVRNQSPFVMQEEEDTGRGGLPAIIVAPFMLASDIMKFSMAFIANTTTVAFFSAFALVDWLLDIVFMFTLGLICRPCALLLVWIVNLAYLPIYFLAQIHRFFMETMGLIVDGWLLIFNFSGCYMFIGRHCGMFNPGFTPSALDIPILNALGLGDKETVWNTIKNLVKLPEMEKPSDVIKVRHGYRKQMLQAIPLVSELMNLADLVIDHIDF